MVSLYAGAEQLSFIVGLPEQMRPQGFAVRVGAHRPYSSNRGMADIALILYQVGRGFLGRGAFRAGLTCPCLQYKVRVCPPAEPAYPGILVHDMTFGAGPGFTRRANCFVGIFMLVAPGAVDFIWSRRYIRSR